MTPEVIPERKSVIVYTPLRSPLTSTPHNSPSKFPVQPARSCQSLGPIEAPRSRSHSPSCSEISSINGEVFVEAEEDVAAQEALDPIPTVRVRFSWLQGYYVTGLIKGKGVLTD